MKKILLALSILAVLACASCQRRCHCRGYDGSHVYYTKDEVSEMGFTCTTMQQQYMLGLVYATCEYDLTDY